MQRNEDRQNTTLEIGYSAGSLLVLVTGLQSQSSFECAAAVAGAPQPTGSRLSLHPWLSLDPGPGLPPEGRGGTAAGPPAPAFCEGKQRTDQRGSERDGDKEDEHGPGPLMTGCSGLARSLSREKTERGPKGANRNAAVLGEANVIPISDQTPSLLTPDESRVSLILPILLSDLARLGTSNPTNTYLFRSALSRLYFRSSSLPPGLTSSISRPVPSSSFLTTYLGTHQSPLLVLFHSPASFPALHYADFSALGFAPRLVSGCPAAVTGSLFL
ncbi:hypothetical protein CSIM01_04616 [Colletotrichum simmondsii]|uniref:Uncharacterized protein n=1 Tax=Colletotrichum simmondsii TaxID=703756 RepID=A0A135SGS1_9PEZI|nr:hypothetical protein CSIM01_04616 [Colletotrichum simmondsii]